MSGVCVKCGSSEYCWVYEAYWINAVGSLLSVYLKCSAIGHYQVFVWEVWHCLVTIQCVLLFLIYFSAMQNRLSQQEDKITELEDRILCTTDEMGMVLLAPMFTTVTAMFIVLSFYSHLFSCHWFTVFFSHPFCPVSVFVTSVL